MTDGEIRASYRQAKYPREQIQILAQLTCKSVSEIKQICGIEDMPRRKKWGWSKEDVEFVKANTNLTNRQVADALNKDINHVRALRKKLKLSNVRIRRIWTEQEIEFIVNARKNGLNYDDIAKYLERPVASVYAKTYELRQKGRL